MTLNLTRGSVLTCIGIISALLAPASGKAVNFYCNASGTSCIPTYTVNGCAQNPSAACVVLAAFDNKQGTHWFANFNGDGSVASTDGIPNAPFYVRVNGGTQYVVHTNNSNSPGLALVVTGVGASISVYAGPDSNSGGRGYCNNATTLIDVDNLPFSPNNSIFTDARSYTCPNY